MDALPPRGDNIVNAPFEPSPLARAILHEHVTQQKFRLIGDGDSRLGPLATTFALSAGILVGTHTRLIGFIDAGRQLSQEEITSVAAAASYWAADRVATQHALHVDITVVVLGDAPVIASPPPPQTNVHITVFAVNTLTAAVTTLMGSSHADPSAHDLGRAQRRINNGQPIPTLAAIDLAEHQIMHSSTAGIQSDMISPTRVLSARAYATYGLIASWVIVYLLEMTIGSRANGANSTVTLAEFGALTNAGGGATDWWRFLSSAFVHDNSTPLHLLFNSVSMFFVGPLVERMYGKLWLITIWILSAVGGSLLWYLTTGSVDFASQAAINTTFQITFGASGGIMGMLGLLASLGLVQGKALPSQFVRSLRTQAIIWAAINIFFNITGDVNQVAHLGGALTGFAIGMIAAPKLALAGRNMTNLEKGVCGVVILGAGVTLAIAAHSAYTFLT